jgi:CO/xanthine dehydrogenase Mo-binding subunit
MIENKRFKDKLAGKVRFPEDMNSKRTLIAKVLRSTESHALIKEIQIPEIPEQIVVIKAGDIRGKNKISVPYGEMPLLADKKVMFKGEAILLAAGPDEDELINFLSTITIEYEPLALLQFPEAPEDFISRREITKGAPGEFQEKAWKVFHSHFSTASQEHLATPVLSAYAKIEGQKITMNCSTQWPSNVVQNISSVTGLPKKNITIKLNPPGKSLDSKIWMPSLIAAQAALLSLESKKPVRLVYTVQEEFLCSPKRIPVEFQYHAAIDKSGKLIALNISFFLNTGSRKMMTDEILDRMCMGVAGVYQCKNIKVTGSVYRSNRPPMGAFSGFGLAQAFFASERMATIISERLIALQKEHIHSRIAEAVEQGDEVRLKTERTRTTTDPAIWREKNFLIKGNTYLSSGQLKKDPPLVPILQQLLKKSDFTRKYAAYANVVQNRDKMKSRPTGRRGIGIANSYMGRNFLRRDRGLFSSTVICRLDKEGKLTIITSSISDNFVLLKIWQQHAKRILAIDEENIEIIDDENNQIPLSGPATLSRNVTITTRLLIQGLENIKKRRFRDPLPLEVKKSFKNTAARKWDTNSFTGLPFLELSWAAGAVEVEINENTFVPELRKIWMVIDCGQILSREAAIAEVESEIMQAIGWCSVEDLPFDENDKTEMDISAYTIAGIRLKPEISIDFIESNNKSAKGLGGLVLNCIPAAYCSAVSQATGFEFTSIPIQPHHVFSAMEEK